MSFALISLRSQLLVWGSVFALLLMAPFANAQTGTGTDTGTGAFDTATGTPGFPDTGLGGDPTSVMLILGLSALVMLSGLALLAALRLSRK